MLPNPATINILLKILSHPSLYTHPSIHTRLHKWYHAACAFCNLPLKFNYTVWCLQRIVLFPFGGAEKPRAQRGCPSSVILLLREQS